MLLSPCDLSGYRTEQNRHSFLYKGQMLLKLLFHTEQILFYPPSPHKVKVSNQIQFKSQIPGSWCSNIFAFLAEKIYKDQKNFSKAPLKWSNFKTADHSKTWIQLKYGGEEGEQLHGSFNDMNKGFWIILLYTNVCFFFNIIAAFQDFKKKDWALILLLQTQ